MDATEVREALTEALSQSSENETLCASFRPADGENPWVQVIPGTLNLYWPWEDGDESSLIARLRAAMPSLPESVEVSMAEPGTFATFDVEIASDDVARWAEIVEAAFHQLFEEKADTLDVEIYAIQDDDIPDRVPIRHEPGSPTETIGTFGNDDGQFMAFVVATLPDPVPEDWEAHKRWYAVLHRFDSEGEHLGTEAEFLGTTAAGETDVVERARARLREMTAQLGEHRFEDVAVGLFSTTIDGHEFGLVDASYEDEEDESVFVEAELRPNGLVFRQPWDGEYDT